MRTPRLLLLAALIGACTFIGCTSNGRVREVSPGLYSASVTGDGYVSAPKLREAAVERAEQFCAHQGKRMRLTGEESVEAHAGNDTTIRVPFRCVDG
jgi:hypothetical protein